jgi:hypothetical protein
VFETNEKGTKEAARAGAEAPAERISAAVRIATFARFAEGRRMDVLRPGSQLASARTARSQ